MEEQSSQQEPQQQHPFEHLGNWKVVIGIGVVIAIVLVFSFAFNLLQAHMYPTPKDTVSSQVKSASPEGVKSPQVSPTLEIPELSQQHLSNFFSMKYPSGWTESESESLGSIIVTFQGGEGGDAAPKMTVTSLDLTTSGRPLSEGEDLYRAYKYQENTTTVDHMQATKFTSVFPPQQERNEYAGPLLWDTHLFVTKGTNDYAIRYTYPGTNQDPAYEKLFSDMLATLQLR